ncbi:uncharacterized protein LOC114520617 [Dendronephthya gigantea]|uniref:uncharacterized protein LOC114520617 n=1 Tax=Dendronephthya gigantea TaxID=151771 RepID=UPI0010691FD3|nr:uncharacterized protein LOC114520617 [Dendronephthya gigantea]
MNFCLLLVVFYLVKHYEIAGYGISVSITTDNYGSLITNTGEERTVNGDWQTYEHFTLRGDTKTVTIKARNPGEVGGILASFNNSVVTDTSWECADMKGCESSCAQPGWEQAVAYGRNDDPTTIWYTTNGNKTVDKISSDAQWIWVRDELATKVWCRKTFDNPTTSSQLQTKKSVHNTEPPLALTSQSQTSGHNTDVQGTLSHSTEKLDNNRFSQTSRHDTATSTSTLSPVPTQTTSHSHGATLQAFRSLSRLQTQTTTLHGKASPSLSQLPMPTTSHSRAIPPSSSRTACVSMSTTRVENHKLEGFVFNEFRVKNVADCAMKCFAEIHCFSFNFIPATMSCELNNSAQRLGSKNLKATPDVNYFYRNL